MISIEEKTKRIIEDIQQEKGCNPVRIFKNMAQKEYISIHGPEHHILDGACILTAFYNAGGNIRLEESLNKIAREGLPVIGIPCKSAQLDGMDALLATVMMPTGIPVATVAVDGAANAAILAVEMLALSDEVLAQKLEDMKADMEKGVAEKDKAMQAKVAEL